MDPSLISAAVTAVAAAAGAFGQGVLTAAENQAADGTVRLGLRLLSRLRRSKVHGTAVESAVADVARHPGDPDFTAALRAQVRNAVEAEPDLAADLAELLKSAGVQASAIGHRSVAAPGNEGIVSTGDNAVNQVIRP
jgi:hypothetical protein